MSWQTVPPRTKVVALGVGLQLHLLRSPGSVPRSTLGTAGTSVHNFPFYRKPQPLLLSQIPHWEQLVAAAVPHLFGFSLPSPFFGVCWLILSPVPNSMLEIAGGVHKTFYWPLHSDVSLVNAGVPSPLSSVTAAFY